VKGYDSNLRAVSEERVWIVMLSFFYYLLANKDIFPRNGQQNDKKKIAVILLSLFVRVLKG
jgi:hypothetical protein